MKIKYRPEIDGLRAIAVLSVFFYHAQIFILNKQIFKGGFIGVDIFFVISGYLITSIILKELITNDSFSFKNFFERRIRRILPVLLFIMLVTMPLAWMYLLPSSFIDFSKSIIYSLGFSSNLYFWHSGLQYASEDGLLKPFLHTWSLSIEEQYYILFPIILFVVFKYFRKYLLNIIIFGVICSLIIADWGSKNHTLLNFYILPTRSWELLIGSILSYLEINLVYRSKNHTLNLIFSIIGLLLIGYSIFFFSDTMYHPSFYTLLPIAGIIMLIWFSNRDQIITKILSSKLFVGLGLISYSFYLWHYPVLAFYRVVNGLDNEIIVKVILSVIILLLSIFTYFIIEKPARNKNIKFSKILIFILTIYVLLLSINLLVIKKSGFREIRYDNVVLDNKLLRIESWKHLDPKPPQFSNNKSKIKVLLLGDSHSKDMFNVFYLNKDIFQDYEFSRLSGKILNGDETDENRKIFDSSDVVIITFHFAEPISQYKLEDFIIKYKKEKKIILLSNTNFYKSDFTYKKYGRYYNHLTLTDILILKKKGDDISIQDRILINKAHYENRILIFDKVNKEIENLSSKFGVKYLRKQDFLCDYKKRLCDGITVNNKKIFSDYDHYTLDGAKHFGKKINRINWFKYD